jgi:hypothetical protein
MGRGRGIGWSTGRGAVEEVPARSSPPAAVASSRDEEIEALKETVDELRKRLAYAMERLNGLENDHG